MALPASARAFGMRQIVLTPINLSTGVPTAGSAVQLPASQKLTFTETEEFVELRGDDKSQTKRGKGPLATWAMSHGGISLDAYKIVAGGSVASSGVSPNAVKTFEKAVDDVRPFFMAEGRAINDNGGDTHLVLLRCRATGDIKGEFADGAFWITDLSGDAFGSEDPATLNKLYRIIQNETGVVITVP